MVGSLCSLCGSLQRPHPMRPERLPAQEPVQKFIASPLLLANALPLQGVLSRPVDDDRRARNEDESSIHRGVSAIKRATWQRDCSKHGKNCAKQARLLAHALKEQGWTEGDDAADFHGMGNERAGIGWTPEQQVRRKAPEGPHHARPSGAANRDGNYRAIDTANQAGNLCLPVVLKPSLDNDCTELC